MNVFFHTDPIYIKAIFDDLLHHGVVVIETTRPYFRSITDRVASEGVTVLPLAANGADGDFFNLIFRAALIYEVVKTNARVMETIQSWQCLDQSYSCIQYY